MMHSFAFKFGFAVVFAVGAVYSTYAIVNMILDSVQRGFWRDRYGSITYLATSPKAFWFQAGAVILLAVLIWVVTVLSFFAAFASQITNR